MPFIAPIFGAIGSAFGALGITAQTLISVALNVGMALIQMLMNRPPKPDDITNVVRQSLPVRMVHLGRVRTGGPLLFIETKARILYMIQYFGQGPCSGFEEFILDNRPCALDRKGWVTTKPYDYKDGDIVRIFTRAGATRGTPYKIIQTVFRGVVTTKWRGDRLVTACIRARSVNADKVAKFYPNRLPSLNVVARFGSCYNPGQDAREWTESLPLHLLEYLTHEDGLGLDRDLIDAAGDFRRAHRTASEIVETKSGGSERRYYGSTTWKLDEQPKDIINRMLMAMDGWVYLQPDGKIGLKVGEWEEPTVHIPDDKIIDCELRDSSTPIQEANEIVVKYTNPAANWTEASCDPWRDEAGLRRAGGRVKNTTVELYGIQNHNHARRIAKILDQKLNPRWQGTVRTTLWGMQAWDQRFITISYDDFGIDAQPFEILRIGLDEETMSVILEVASVERTLYDFDPQEDEGTAPINPESLGDDGVPTPENFRAVVTSERIDQIIANSRQKTKRLTLTLSVDVPRRNINDKTVDDEEDDDEDDDDNSERAVSVVSTEQDDDDDLLYEFQYAKANTGRWRSLGGLIEEPEAETTNIVDGQRYDARVRFRTGEGLPGDWVTIEDILAIGDTDAPGSPLRITARRTGPRQVTVTCTSRDQDNFAAVELWRDKDKTARGSTLVTTVYGAQDSEITLVDDDAPIGTRYYFVRSINFSGVGSIKKAARNNPVRIPK